MSACFVVSLDFELYWGVRDRVPLNAYRRNLLGAREAIPRILDTFTEYSIRATWATVGFLFARDRHELLELVPPLVPQYHDTSLSPYGYLSRIGRDEREDPFHYGRSLVECIAKTPGQQVGTHTFSHYYCLEPGQTEDQFDADLRAAGRVASEFGNVCEALVFPRNQFNPAYLPVLRRYGVKAYRSNGSHWAYRARPGAHDQPHRRAARLLDAYLPLFRAGHSPVSSASDSSSPKDLPASAFLRPVSTLSNSLAGQQLRRLEQRMQTAADHGAPFHLWWHPHNFGTRLQENIDLLRRVLDARARMDDRGHFPSLTMGEAAELSGAH